MSDPIALAFQAAARDRLAKAVERIKHCLGQLDEAQVWYRPRESLNSIANLILHLCGNLRQWILAGVGGAADDRNRPQEFAERSPLSKAELIRRLEAVAQEADLVLARLTTAQWLEKRRIQGFEATVLSATWDSLTHLCGHTQEIIYITRLQLGEAYQFAWVPTTPEQGAPP